MSHKFQIYQRLRVFSPEIFSPQTNKEWAQRLDDTRPTFKDLSRLIERESEPEFKARALTVILTNNPVLIPFEWDYQLGVGHLLDASGDDTLDLMDLPEKLANLAGDIIMLNISYSLHQKNTEDYHRYHDFLRRLTADHPVAKRVQGTVSPRPKRKKRQPKVTH